MNKWLVLFFLFVKLELVGQWLPNADFENWKSVGISEEPENWGTYNQISFSGGVINAFKDSNAQNGSFALRLESKYHVNPVNGSSGVYTGIAALNASIIEGDMGLADFPLRPIKLSGYYKSEVMQGDSCIIYGVLQKWSETEKDYQDIGAFYKVITHNESNWTPFDAMVYYFEQVKPEKIAMFFLAGDYNSPIVGNKLYIDNLNFTYYASAVNDYAQVRPNEDVNIPVLNNDEGMNIYLDIIGTPLHGSVQQSGSAIRYIPNADFKGRDEFVYTICDGLNQCDEGKVVVDIMYGLNIDSKELEFKLFPNPVSENLNLCLPSLIKVDNIRLINIMGETVREIAMPSSQVISLDGIPSGSYFIVLESSQLSMPIKKAVNVY